MLDERQERLLVLATLEELLQHELVLREPTEDGVQLVFPSAYRRDLPPSEAPKGDGVVFRFEGPVENVYATLIVRLTRSDRFTRSPPGSRPPGSPPTKGECTVFLKYDGEGKAELWIGYDRVPDALRNQFERFMHAHLDRRATREASCGSVSTAARDDGTAFTSEQVERVRSRGRTIILCPVCEERVSLRDDYEPRNGSDQSTAAMDASADAGRRSSPPRTAVLRGKEEVAEFDVFLCHNWDDKPAVRELAQRSSGSAACGPGWTSASCGRDFRGSAGLEDIIAGHPGRGGDRRLTSWARGRTRSSPRSCGSSSSGAASWSPCSCPGLTPPNLPVFLDGLTWVDLHVTEPDPLDQLVWGISGEHENR